MPPKKAAGAAAAAKDTKDKKAAAAPSYKGQLLVPNCLSCVELAMLMVA